MHACTHRRWAGRSPVTHVSAREGIFPGASAFQYGTSDEHKMHGCVTADWYVHRLHLNMIHDTQIYGSAKCRKITSCDAFHSSNIRLYEVVYGSPCGRPEKVCLFILPWLALRTGLVLKRTVVILSWVALKRTWTRCFGQVDCPSSGVARCVRSYHTARIAPLLMTDSQPVRNGESKFF